MENGVKKVLVVDDDNNLRDILSDKLVTAGFDVQSASNGKDGLDKALDWHPDIILLDILMPIMDGWEALGHIREDKWGKEAKVIMLTVVESAEAIARAVQDGGFGYLIKTQETPDSIVTKVSEMLARQ